MAEQLNYQINVTGNAGESVGSLKKQLREAQAEVAVLSDKFGATSKEAVQAAKRAAELKDRIGDAKALTDAFNPDAKFKALSASLAGVAGGFAAVQGAIGLFGAESKELEKQLLKVQSALALSQGLQAIGESIDSWKQLGAVIQSTTLFTRLNSAANTATAATMRALGIAVDTTATSFRVLKTAIAATGIGLAVIAIGELISAISNYASAAERAKEAQDKLNESITKSAEGALQAEIDQINRSNDLLVAQAKLRGATEKEILDIEQSSRKLRIAARNRFNKDVADANQEEADKNLREIRKEQDAIQIAEINFQTDQKKRKEEANKKAEEENKKNVELRKQREKEEDDSRRQREERQSAAQKVEIEAFRARLTQRQQDVLRAEDELENKKLTLIRAGNFDFENIEEEHRIKLAEINAKYDKEELDKKKAIDEVNAKREKELAEINAITLEDKKALELQNLEDQYNKELLLAIQNGENVIALEQLNAAKKLEIDAKYLDEKKKIDAQVLQAEVDLQNAKFSAASAGLNLLGSLVGENEKLANALFVADKALAIAKIVVDTQREIAGYAANPTWTLLPDGGLAIKSKASLAAKLRAGASIATIAATTISKFKGGAASANFGQGGAINTAGTPIVPTQQVQLTQLNQQSINAIGNSAIRAYVVETDITGNQKRIQAIKQRARFG